MQLFILARIKNNLYQITGPLVSSLPLIVAWVTRICDGELRLPFVWMMVGPSRYKATNNVNENMSPITPNRNICRTFASKLTYFRTIKWSWNYHLHGVRVTSYDRHGVTRRLVDNLFRLTTQRTVIPDITDPVYSLLVALLRGAIRGHNGIKCKVWYISFNLQPRAVDNFMLIYCIHFETCIFYPTCRSWCIWETSEVHITEVYYIPWNEIQR